MLELRGQNGLLEGSCVETCGMPSSHSASWRCRDADGFWRERLEIIEYGCRMVDVICATFLGFIYFSKKSLGFLLLEDVF